MGSLLHQGSLFLLIFLSVANMAMAQEDKESRLVKIEEDKALIDKVENQDEPDKVFHAEPLYIDLIRDLGARKGEKEWNLGFGLLDRDEIDEIEALIEYEFAPINRLGLEIELPFSFFPNDSGSSNRLNSLQLAAQYTFHVSLKHSTSMAIGYLHEFELISFDQYGNEALYKGNVFNPFFIAAKRWGNHFHTLIYTGPVFERLFNSGETESSFEINTNFHFMIPGTINFIGLEVNMETEDRDFKMTLRPQMRVEVSEQILIGLVSGLGVVNEDERLSMFFRLIYEPD